MSRLVATFAVAATALATACSGGGSGSTADSSQPTSGQSELLAFSRCMRDKGIADFPDPGSNGIGLDGLGIDQDSPQFKAAQEACRQLLPPERDATEPSGSGGAGGESDWEKVVPGGECECVDGSQYSFYARKANPKKIVLFLDGGGVCWSAETCDPAGTNRYQRTADRPNGEGALDFGRTDNPFADFSFVYVPYCTGDLHVGTATTKYRPDLTVHHKGYLNGSAALDYLAETYPDATDVVVIGISAGSVSAPLYAGLASDRLPDANITVFADSSGSYPDRPELNAILNGRAWGAGNALPGWPENAGPTAHQWSLPGLFIRSGRHDPDIVFARYDHAYDEDQASHLSLAGVRANDLLALLGANEAQIEDAGVNLHSYTAPGDDHVVFQDHGFYTETVNDVALVDWVKALLSGEPFDDVHCKDCNAP